MTPHARTASSISLLIFEDAQARENFPARLSLEDSHADTRSQWATRNDVSRQTGM
jgi:hypothetical protein